MRFVVRTVIVRPHLQCDNSPVFSRAPPPMFDILRLVSFETKVVVSAGWSIWRQRAIDQGSGGEATRGTRVLEILWQRTFSRTGTCVETITRESARRFGPGARILGWFLFACKGGQKPLYLSGFLGAASWWQQRQRNEPQLGRYSHGWPLLFSRSSDSLLTVFRHNRHSVWQSPLPDSRWNHPKQAFSPRVTRRWGCLSRRLLLRSQATFPLCRCSFAPQSAHARLHRSGALGVTVI